MNQAEQKAYDALGRVQKYYQIHGVAMRKLWTKENGVKVSHPNGEDKACIWGALIATGGATGEDYRGRASFKVQTALEEAGVVRIFADGPSEHKHTLIGMNDGYVQGDIEKMRTWLAKARRLLKAGKIV